MRYAVVVEAGETGFGEAIPPPSSTIELIDFAA